MFQHTSDCSGTTGTKDVMEMPLPNEMHCICGFSTANGNNMAHHLASCGQKSAYPSLQVAQENTVKRNMLDMLGLVKRDGEGGTEGETGSSDQNMESGGDNDDAQSSTAHDTVNADHQQQQSQTQADENLQQQQQQHQEPMDAQQSMAPDQTPIPFGQMDATPVEQQQHTQHYAHIVDNTSHLQVPGQNQYHLGFGQSEVAPHTLNAADIDMPLIGELADPNPPPTPQFLGEVHTPMFDAVAAAEQQHYHQMMQQQQQQQQHHLQQHPHIQHHQQQ